MGQARALGSRLLASKTPLPETTDRLKDLHGQTNYLAEQYIRSLEKAVEANPALKAQLQASIDSTSVAVRDGVALIKRVAAGRSAGNDAENYFARITRSVDAAFEAKVQAMAVLDELLVRRIDKFRKEIAVTLAAAVFGLLIVSVLAFLIMLDITRPLHRVVHIADRIAEGDLAVELSQSQARRDEIGELARSFDRMVGFLREMVHVTGEIAAGNLTVAVKPQSQRDAIGNALVNMVANLSGLVGQVQRSGIQVNTSVNQIAATAKQQQATATEIAATTMEVGATSKQISATSKELLKNVGEVSKVADQSATLAGSGQAGLTHMEETMRQVVEAAGAINAKLAVLNEKAGNISQVITTITKVADQTNLLSLNAAIEAEKAGEYGRGFSVVATEIRRLADQTAVATFDIEQMVKEIQSAVSAGVMGMDKFSEDVRRGMQDVQQVGGQLTQIIQQVQTLAPRFEEVNEGMQAQSTGAEQITHALGQLNEAAQQTVESLRQSTQAIEGLNDVAGGLRSGVARFKLAAA
jgi:methyl-accepting chemotaxis protein WspA